MIKTIKNGLLGLVLVGGLVVAPYASNVNAASLTTDGNELTTSYGVEVNTTGFAPNAKYNGSPLSSNAPYVWSSENSSVVSFGSNNRTYSTNSVGDTRIALSYMNETAYFDIKVRNIARFQERPMVQVIPVLNIGTQVYVNGFKDKVTGLPVSGKSVSFHARANPTSPQLCSGITDANGNVSCNTNMLLNGNTFLFAYFAGDSTYAQASRQTAE